MLPFDYVRPSSFAEVSDFLIQAKGKSQLLAGGTDLIVGLRHHKIPADLVIDLKQIDEFRVGISEKAGTLVVPAGTTMTELTRDPRIRRHFPALLEAASVVGSVQIRNRATLAGNICNASPAADTVPVLALHDASVVIYGPDGTRTVAVRDFVLGNRSIALNPGELVTAIHLPVPDKKSGAAFERITRRRGVDLATVNLTCLVVHGRAPRFALGAVAPRPVLVEGEGDVDALFSVATPISDVRAGADYRRAMLSVIGRRALDRARKMLSEEQTL